MKKRRVGFLMVLLMILMTFQVQAAEENENAGMLAFSFKEYFGSTLEEYCKEAEIPEEEWLESVPSIYCRSTPEIYQGKEFQPYLSLDRSTESIVTGGYRYETDTIDESLWELVNQIKDELTQIYGEPYEYPPIIEVGGYNFDEMESIEDVIEAGSTKISWEIPQKAACEIEAYAGMAIQEWINLGLQIGEDKALITISYGLQQDLNIDMYVSTAINEIYSYWKNEKWYKEYGSQGKDDSFNLEIKNTRVIKMKKNEDELLKDAYYIVEFVLYTDYLGTGPYYMQVDDNATVVFDGYDNATVWAENPFDMYRSRNYNNDFVDHIMAVFDLKDAYNQVLKLQ